VTRLLRAELLRLRSRRAAVMMLVGLVLLVLAIVLGFAFLTSGEPPDEETLRGARETYDTILEGCRQDPICDVEEFRRDTTVENFYDDERLVLSQDAELPLGVIAVISAIASLMIGASFIGSEGHHNMLGNLLVWEPRRARVLGAKTIAVAISAGLAGLALGLMLFTGLWLVAAIKGVTSAPVGFVGETFAGIARGSVLSAFGAILGVGLTSLVRSTAAGLGVGLVYLAVIERFLSVLRPRWQPWMVGDLSVALFTGEHRIYFPGEVVRHELPDGGFTIAERFEVLTAGRGALVLGIYLAVLLAIAILEFRRRDVT
jgi:hypothetical protein